MPSTCRHKVYMKRVTILNFLGLYEGTSTISFNPDLAAQVDLGNRYYPCCQVVWERNDAMAMTYFEAESILSNFSDKNDIQLGKEIYSVGSKKRNDSRRQPNHHFSKKPVDGRSYATML